jgi:hypothetical protein
MIRNKIQAALISLAVCLVAFLQEAAVTVKVFYVMFLYSVVPRVFIRGIEDKVFTVYDQRYEQKKIVLMRATTNSIDVTLLFALFLHNFPREYADYKILRRINRFNPHNEYLIEYAERDECGNCNIETTIFNRGLFMVNAKEGKQRLIVLDNEVLMMLG